MDNFISPLRHLAGAAAEVLVSATGSAVCPEPFLNEMEVARHPTANVFCSLLTQQTRPVFLSHIPHVCFIIY